MLALIHTTDSGIIFIILYCVTILGLVLVIITENRNPLKTIPLRSCYCSPSVSGSCSISSSQDNRSNGLSPDAPISVSAKRHRKRETPQDACSVCPLPAIGHTVDKQQPIVPFALRKRHHDLYERDRQVSRPFARDCQSNPSYPHPPLSSARRGRKQGQKTVGSRKPKRKVEVRVLYDDVGC